MRRTRPVDHRQRRVLRVLQIGLAVTDAAGRLALPTAVLALGRDASRAALIAALVATSCALLRAHLTSIAIERSLGLAWIQVVGAARARPAAEIPRRRESDESVAMLVEGAQEEAVFASSFLPRAGGVAITLFGVAIAVVVLLGPVAIAVGLVLIGVLAGATSLLGRGLREAEARSWDAYGLLTREMRVLLDGALELRAIGREEQVAASALALSRTVAHHRAKAAAIGARLTLLPASLALVAVAAPVDAGAAALRAIVVGDRLFDAAVLGFAAVSAALSASNVWEEWTATRPRRERFRSFTSRAGLPEVAPTSGAPAASLAEVPIAFERFGHAWSEDGHLTPQALDLVLPPRRGVALVGPNGSGKTTAALALLGVVEPTAGAVTVGGVPAHVAARADRGGRVGYVPQDPVLVPGESVAWHCRLHEPEPPSDAAIDAALVRVDLLSALSSRARARGVAARDVAAGELSGGERRRMALARAILRPRELYVLDEPEAALDLEARSRLASLLEELAARARVVLIAHDRAAIPPGFDVVTLPGAAAADPAAPHASATMDSPP